MASEETTPLNLHQKLLVVQQALEHMQAQDHGKRGLKYKYASSSQILGTMRPVMDEVGLLLLTSVVDTTFHPKFSLTQNKADQHLTEVTLELTWVNVDNPEETLTFRGYGQGIDTGEKGSGKAATYAEKTAVLKFFHIPVDEEDPDSYNNRANGKDQARPSREEAATPEPTLGVAGVGVLKEYLGDAIRDEGFIQDMMAFIRKEWPGTRQIVDIPLSGKDKLYAWIDEARVTPQRTQENIKDKIRRYGAIIGLATEVIERQIAEQDDDPDSLDYLCTEYMAKANEQDMDNDVDAEQMTHSEEN